MQRGGKGRVEVSAYIYGRTTPFGLSTGRYCKSFIRLSGPCLKHISRGRCDHIPTHHIPLTQANPAPTPMAHIISCMLDSDSDDIAPSLHNYIAKAVSPQTSNESVCNHSIPPRLIIVSCRWPKLTFSLSATQLGRDSPSGDKPFIWRMMHQTERKYQLFPKDKQQPAAPGKSLDPEQAFALAMGQNGEKSDKTTAGTGLRIRIKEHNLIRRRKVSVPELGPMTTVQEVAMDSRKFMSSLALACFPMLMSSSYHSWPTTHPRAIHQRPGPVLETAPVCRKHKSAEIPNT